MSPLVKYSFDIRDRGEGFAGLVCTLGEDPKSEKRKIEKRCVAILRQSMGESMGIFHNPILFGHKYSA